MESLNYKELLFQSYILMKHVGISYSELKDMNRIDRTLYLEFYASEMEAINNTTK